MKKGITDQQIIDYLVSRYGDFVLYDPPVRTSTVVLWFGPLLMFLAGGAWLFFQLRKRRKSVPETRLTPEAEQRAADLLNDDKN